MQRVEPQDLYAVLGVAPEASAAAIRQAYRALARRLHPDVNAGATEAFRRVADAYEILGDDRRRHAYDVRRADAFRRSGPAAERRAPGPTGNIGVARPYHAAPIPRTADPERGVDEWRILGWVGRTIAAAVVLAMVVIVAAALILGGGSSTVTTPGPEIGTVCQTPDGWVDCHLLDPRLP